MNEFFSQIVGFFETVFQFFVNMVESLLLAINMLIKAVPNILSIGMLYMPAIISTSVMIVCAVSVVKFIIGR